MKIIYNKHFPSKSFAAINLFGIVVARKDCCPLSTSMKRHEAIHSAQMREMLYLPFYIWYGIEWIVRLIQYRNKYAAYFNISFEREAYENDVDEGYLWKRKRFGSMAYLSENKRQKKAIRIRLIRRLKKIAVTLL